jgi:hypothetical protein
MLLTYSDGYVMIQCNAIFVSGGVERTAVLTSRKPSNFDSKAELRKVRIVVSRLAPTTARFAEFGRDWGDTLAKTLGLILIGWMCINQGAKGRRK